MTSASSSKSRTVRASVVTSRVLPSVTSVTRQTPRGEAHAARARRRDRIAGQRFMISQIIPSRCCWSNADQRERQSDRVLVYCPYPQQCCLGYCCLIRPPTSSRQTDSLIGWLLRLLSQGELCVLVRQDVRNRLRSGVPGQGGERRELAEANSCVTHQLGVGASSRCTAFWGGTSRRVDGLTRRGCWLYFPQVSTTTSHRRSELAGWSRRSRM